MPLTSSAKTALRRQLRRRRQALDTQQQNRAAELLAANVARLPHWRGARHIALYQAADGEIDTAVLARLALADNKLLFLPLIGADRRLVFARWHRTQTLQRNRYDIPEPPPNSAQLPVSELDILFLPLVGWDRSGGRLGMGGGFYDRSLATTPQPLLVGLAHECQQVEHIPRDPWDVALDYIVTDGGLYPALAGRGSDRGRLNPE